MPGVTVNTYGQMAVDVNELRAVVRTAIPPDTIENTARGNKVSAQIEEIVAIVDDYNTIFVKKGKEVIHLYTTYGSKPEDFERSFGEMDKEKADSQKKILEARFKMKAVMTPAEWKAVFGPKG